MYFMPYIKHFETEGNALSTPADIEIVRLCICTLVK